MPKFKPLLALGLIAAFAVLYWSDRALSRAEKLDQVVLQGQTGLSWIDELLAKRAAYQAEVEKLEEALAAAKSVEKRIEANYAIIKFETAHIRPEGKRARKALREITSEGGARPQTAVAWGELVRLAIAEESPPKDREDLLNSYAAAVRNLPQGPDLLNRLLELWRLASDNGYGALALSTLQRIQRDFPTSEEAIPAYEALAGIYRSRQNKGHLAAVENSINQTQNMISRRTEEQGLALEFEKYFNDKNPAEAEKVLLQMTPGLIPTVDCWTLFQRLITLYESQAKFAEAELFLMTTSFSTNSAALKNNQIATLFTTLSMLQSEKQKNAESRALLARVPDVPGVKNWRRHLEARLNFDGTTNGLQIATASFPSSPAAARSDSDAGSDPWPTVPWVRIGPANTSTNMPQTRWKATRDTDRLFLLVDCLEPEPDKIVARHDQPDSKIWEDDCVEIFVAPAKTDAFYSQLVINSKGILSDIRLNRIKTLIPCGYAQDLKWSSGAGIAAVKTSSGWRVRATIPWSQMGINSSDRPCFFNVRRQRYVTGKMELFSWSENGLQGHDPSTMGLLLFR